MHIGKYEDISNLQSFFSSFKNKENIDFYIEKIKTNLIYNQENIDFKEIKELEERLSFLKTKEIMYNKDSLEIEPYILLKNKVSIEQIFNIFTFEKKEESFISIKFTSTKDFYNLHIKFENLKLENLLLTREEWIDKVIEEINKKRAKLGLIIGINDSNIRKELEKLSSIKELENLEIITKITEEALEPLNSNLDILKPLNFELIKKNDTVAVLYKTFEGRNAINVKGKFIEKKKNIESDDINLLIGRGLYKEEETFLINIKAEKEGILKLEKVNDKEELFLDEKITLNLVNKIKTGDLDFKKNFTVEIQNNRTEIDTVGLGSILEAKTIISKGHIGKESILKGEEIIIDGNTHKDSLIQGEKTFIHIHRGFLDSKESDIKFLEHGTVFSKKCSVENAVSSKITANIIKIDNLRNHNTITVSKYLYIKEISGIDNIIVVKDILTEDEKEKWLNRAKENMSYIIKNDPRIIISSN